MKSIRTIFILMLIGFITGCAYVYDVSYDFNENANFAGLKTYDWMAIYQESNASRLDSEYVKSIVDAELQTKGFRIGSDNPDFLVTARLGKKATESIHIRGSQPTGWTMRRRKHSVVTTEIEVGTLALDISDAKSKDLIWSGQAKTMIDDEKDSLERKEILIKKAVPKILKDFPPP